MVKLLVIFWGLVLSVDAVDCLNLLIDTCYCGVDVYVVRTVVLTLAMIEERVFMYKVGLNVGVLYVDMSRDTNFMCCMQMDILGFNFTFKCEKRTFY